MQLFAESKRSLPVASCWRPPSVGHVLPDVDEDASATVLKLVADHLFLFVFAELTGAYQPLATLSFCPRISRSSRNDGLRATAIPRPKSAVISRLRVQGKPA